MCCVSVFCFVEAGGATVEGGEGEEGREGGRKGRKKGKERKERKKLLSFSVSDG